MIASVDHFPVCDSATSGPLAYSWFGYSSPSVDDGCPDFGFAFLSDWLPPATTPTRIIPPTDGRVAERRHLDRRTDPRWRHGRWRSKT